MWDFACCGFRLLALRETVSKGVHDVHDLRPWHFRLFFGERLTLTFCLDQLLHCCFVVVLVVPEIELVGVSN
jgi:hypothetical protein